MDHALGVRGLEGLGHLRGDLDRALERDRAALDALREVLALDQLHHQEAQRSVPLSRTRRRGLVELVDRGDVRMIQRRQHAGFALEALQTFAVGSELVGQQLDRDVAAETGVTGAPHHAHAALADLLDQAVVPQLLAG